jgi:hypothetical protein
VQCATERQVTSRRAAHPSVSSFFNTDDTKEEYNASEPVNDRNRWLEQFIHLMGHTGNYNAQDAKVLRTGPLATPTDLKPNAVRDLAGALNILLADMFGLYLKTKNFHWHVSGPHFRDYHLLLDEQGEQIFATTDAIAERVRKIGGTTLRSIGHIGRLQRIEDNDA